ncbi:hypothetical protein GGR51DRAFT_520429 [Nemania sp. FL0031]|nr:hypothetical protein GGR51DRAFT_520429 [Nemania sp. FL0031]
MATILGDETTLLKIPSSPFKESHILNAQDVHGKSALVHAAQHSHFEIVEVLVYNGADQCEWSGIKDMLERKQALVLKRLRVLF